MSSGSLITELACGQKEGTGVSTSTAECPQDESFQGKWEGP